MNDSLLTEQLEYLKANKAKICGEYYGQKVGMDLNLTVHFASIAYLALKKVYSEVHDDFMKSESLIIDIFGDVMESCWIVEDNEFSLKECMKTEAKMVILTDFALGIMRNQKTIYPSEMKRKEAVLNNAHKRACKVIDTYFEERDIMFSEVKDVFDHYEVIVSDQGKIVDFHFGTGGFSLNAKVGSYALLRYIETEKVKIQASVAYVEEVKKELNVVRSQLISEELLEGKRANEITTVRIGSYHFQSATEERIRNIVDLQKSGVEKLYSFLKELKENQIKIPENMSINVENRLLRMEYFEFNYESQNVENYLSQIENYRIVEPFMKKVEDSLGSLELNTMILFRNNTVKIKSHKKYDLSVLSRRLREINLAHNTQPIAQEARTMEELRRTSKRPVRVILKCKNGKLYRESGEQVLTVEVVQFEIMEKLRTVDKDYFISVERAKEMLMSVLSPREEEMMKKEDVTIIEGEKNYYALINRTYNNVIKIPKNIKSADEMKALCIHPAESSIPMYDGFASIVLSVKSGDEDYVLKNSNEFSVQKKVKEKIITIFNSFVPQQELSFA